MRFCFGYFIHFVKLNLTILDHTAWYLLHSFPGFLCLPSVALLLQHQGATSLGLLYHPPQVTEQRQESFLFSVTSVLLAKLLLSSETEPSEEAISTLVSMGFDRNAARQALMHFRKWCQRSHKHHSWSTISLIQKKRGLFQIPKQHTRRMSLLSLDQPWSQHCLTIHDRSNDLANFLCFHFLV